MADDKLEALLTNWGAEYCGRFRDEPRRYRETASHPIARGMQFAPGKSTRHATRQLVGRGGYARRRLMAKATGIKGMHVVSAAVVDPVPCRETRSRFGQSDGIARGVLGALGIPTVSVAPIRWKRHTGLLGAEKDAARLLAIERFPAAAIHLARKKDCGRADALWIAHWANATEQFAKAA